MSTLDNSFVAKLTTVAPPIKEYRLNVYQDSYVLSSYPRTNYGKNNAAQVGNSLTNNAAAMIEFSGVQDIPSKVIENMIDARVNLYYSMKLKHDYTYNVNAYNGRPWSENTIYWENAPAKGELIDTVYVEAGTTNSMIDITDSLKSQITNKSNTVGIYLNSTDEASNAPLCVYTKEHYNRKFRPTLVIRYFDIPGVPILRYINGTNLTILQKMSGNNMQINGEVGVGVYTIQDYLNCADGNLIIPKFTAFDLSVTNSNNINYHYNSSYDVISNADNVAVMEGFIENEQAKSSSSSGDLITGNVSVETIGESAFINGSVDVPRLFTFTTLFKNKNDEVLFTFDKGTNVDDATFEMPFDKTEQDGGEISGEVETVGFGGYHYINGEFNVAREVEAPSHEDTIDGTLRVAWPVSFDNDENTITGEIEITPYVYKEMEGSIKVPKLFVFDTVLKNTNEETGELETVYTFPKGKDIDDYEYTEPYESSEQDGGEISGEVESVGKKWADITGSLLVVLEVPNIEISCDKWDDENVYYQDADFYVLANYEENKDDDNNIITCETSDVDYTNYESANMYVKAMVSIPTYYNSAGQIIPNPIDVYRVEFKNGTYIAGVVGIPHEDPIVTDINGTFDVANAMTNIISCDPTEDYDHTTGENFENIDEYIADAKENGMYVEAKYARNWLGSVTVKCESNTWLNSNGFIIGKDVEGIDDITCEASDVDYTQYESANMYVKAMAIIPVYVNGAGQPVSPRNAHDIEYRDHYGNKAYIEGSVRPMFGVHEDINGTIIVYGIMNNGGWIDCDKTEVDGINVKYTDANMFVVKTVEGYINGTIEIVGSKTIDINSDGFVVGNEIDPVWINGGTAGLKIAVKANDTWINGNIEVREMVTSDINGTIEIEPKATTAKYSYAYIL